MKTLNYILFICVCISFASCSSEPEEPYVDPNPYIYGEIRPQRLALMGMPRPADSYNFQLYSNMPEWAELKSSAEMVAVFQVPEHILKRMSTQAVIQAIWEKWDVGMLFTVSSNDMYQALIEGRIRTYRDYEELTKRKDAGKALLQRLTVVNPLTGVPHHESQELELLLSRPAILSQLDKSEKRKTVEITLAHEEIRYPTPSANMYQLTRAAAMILMGKTMISAGYGPFIEAYKENEELKYFIDNINRFDPTKNGYIYHPYYYGNIPELIIDYAKNYIND